MTGGPERASDTLIIGAGAVGASIAFHLAQSGVGVRVLERDAGPERRATSTRSFGLVWAQSKAPNAYLELSLASVSAYPALLAELGDDCSYERPGGMLLIETEEQERGLRALMAEQQLTSGFEVRFLDAREMRELDPALSDRLLGATFSPHDGHLDPRRLVDALTVAAVRHGAVLDRGVEVTRIAPRGAAWVVETTVGTYSAGSVVNAAGVWAREIASRSGVDLPVDEVRGQVVVSDVRPRLLHHPTPDVRQAPDGRVWMGTVHERDDWDLAPRASDTARILSMAARLVPALAGVTVERVWAGLRAIPRDGFPIAGPVPGQPGHFVAVTHSGITLAAVLGPLMRDLITSGNVPPQLQGFGLERESLRGLVRAAH